MQKFIRIVADQNDADYVSSMKPITDKQLELVTPMIKVLKNFKPYKGKVDKSIRPGTGKDWTHEHNFCTGECLREDLGEKSPEQLYVESGLVSKDCFEQFDDLLPSCEGGIHTIKSVDEVTKVNKLFEHHYAKRTCSSS